MPIKKPKNRFKKAAEQVEVREENLGDQDIFPNIDAAEDNELKHDNKSESVNIKDLKDQLDIFKKKAAENMEIALRTKAEAENIRRRAEKDIASAHKFGVEKMINQLLPILDSLAQGLESVKNKQSSAETLIIGAELVVKMFSEALHKFNVEIINPMGEKFDPNKHEAIAMIKDPNTPANHIINVVQKGYILSERLIRPARVVVATE